MQYPYNWTREEIQEFEQEYNALLDQEREEANRELREMAGDE